MGTLIYDLSNEIKGDWKITQYLGNSYWEAENLITGDKKKVRSNHWRKGIYKKRQNLSGQTINGIYVIAPTGETKHNNALTYLVRYPDGTLKEALGEHLISGFVTGKRSENRIKKLQKNNKSGYSGVYQEKGDDYKRKWKAEITVNNKRIRLGHFYTKQEAIKARKKAEQKYFN